MVAVTTIVKLGGSHALSPRLRDWVGMIAGGAGDVVLVPGGGPFADGVRAAQARMGFDDRAAHRMALLAMEQYGVALASLDARLEPAADEDAISRVLAHGRVPVWMPSRMALAAPEIAESWDVTSDSLAAWLAVRLGAKRLVLIKPVDVDGIADPETLSARGVVDPALAGMLRDGDVALTILGPRRLSSPSLFRAEGADCGAWSRDVPVRSLAGFAKRRHAQG